MSKSLAKFVATNELAPMEGPDLGNSLGEALEHSDAVGGQSGDVNYLTFSGKTGNFSYGKKKESVEDHLFIVEPMAFTEGWVCWKGGKAAAQYEWPFLHRASHAMAEADLEDKGPYNEKAGEGWKQTLGIRMIDPESDNKMAAFSVSSVSGRNAFSDLMYEVSARGKKSEPEMPIVYFECEQFEAQGQKNWKPVVMVETWTTRAAVSAYLDGSMSWDQLIAGKLPPKKRAPRKRK